MGGSAAYARCFSVARLVNHALPTDLDSDELELTSLGILSEHE